MNKPLIAIIGRANVGKSTLFNALTRSRDALVAEFAGLTRDRTYGECKIETSVFRIVDTGGMLHDKEQLIDRQVDKQARNAAQEADIILFVLDGKAGLTPDDEAIMQELRRLKKPVLVLVNKADFQDSQLILADFYQLGMPLLAISAEHRRGLQQLGKQILAIAAELPASQTAKETEEDLPEDCIKLAVLGRPNVGKSTLLNRILGEERLVASEIAGTTRDAIFIPYTDANQDKFILIDTAGIRRKSQTHDKIEKFSIVKALAAVDYANVVVLVLDAQRSIAEQDAKLLGEITRRGRGLIIAINKSDSLSPDDKHQIKQDLERKLHFIDYAQILYISALKGSNVHSLLPAVKEVWHNAMRELPTKELNEVLQTAYARHQPPLVQGKAIKFQYAHQGGKNPPHIIIHGSRTQSVPDSYTQYLTKYLRKHFKLFGTPIRISYRDKFNPYANS